MGMLSAILLLAATAASFAGRPELSDRLQLERVHGPKEVKVIRAAGARETFLTQGDALFVGDEIRTTAGQVVEISAWDKSAWKVAPLSSLKLESRKPDQNSGSYWVMDLVKGGMWGKVAKENSGQKEGYKLKVKTKHATMGVRGTEYLVGGDQKLSTLDVLEGTVWWGKDPAFAAGTYREVKAGQHAEMGPDGKVNLHSSEGDVPTLAKRYGVVPEEEGGGAAARPAPVSKQVCTEKGKGWKSIDGSNLGECIDEGEKE